MRDEQKLEHIKQHIGAFENFPKEGILFRDIFTALRDGKTCTYLRDLLVSHIRQHYPDVEMIVGLDSRGFLFNLLVASELGIGCAPIRKKGKLPGDCISVDYAKEYGTDVFEMQTAAIQPGQKIIIIDDLLATGGSLEAALKLVRKAGGDVLECLVVIELECLNGRKKINSNMHSLIKY